MKTSRRNQIIAVAMAALMSQAPSFVFATTMVPTQELVNEMSRAEAEQKISNELQRTEIQELLLKNGISPQEASSRLASLSDQELQNFAGQIQEARAGGSILVEILIVVLIIFLVKRI